MLYFITGILISLLLFFENTKIIDIAHFVLRGLFIYSRIFLVKFLFVLKCFDDITIIFISNI